jgi:hypothetical protein
MTSFHAEKWGLLGTIFVAACCLGLTWLVSLASALGAGFLIRDSILMPLLIIVFLPVGMFTARPLSYAGIALLVAAPLFDLYAQSPKERPPAAGTQKAG